MTSKVRASRLATMGLPLFVVIALFSSLLGLVAAFFLLMVYIAAFGKPSPGPISILVLSGLCISAAGPPLILTRLRRNARHLSTWERLEPALNSGKRDHRAPELNVGREYRETRNSVSINKEPSVVSDSIRGATRSDTKPENRHKPEHVVFADDSESATSPISRIRDGQMIFVGILFGLIMSAATGGAYAIYLAWALYLEMRGITVDQKELTYPVRIRIWGPYAFPLFLRSIRLSEVDLASSETMRNNKKWLEKFRLINLSGSDGTSKLWLGSVGRRDQVFSALKASAPHIRIYRGR